MSNALKSIHEALDDRQRKIAGDMLEQGLRGGGYGPWSGGPYRSHWA
jgi:hypothetical protein